MMSKIKIVNISYFFIALTVFTYVLIRAFTVGVTYDEVWTMNLFVKQSVFDIITHNPPNANNHILNTLLIKFLFIFGNQSLFIARLPNLLAFIVYLFFGYKIASQRFRPVVGIGCFLLLLMNPFLLDFFSLARGYGLSLGFLMASFYYFLLFFDRYLSRHALLALVFGGLAVLSMIPLLNYFVVILFLIIFIPIIFKKLTNYKTTFFSSLFLTLIFGALLFLPIEKLLKNDCLYYGGCNNFYSDTLISLTRFSMYSPDVNSKIHIVLLIVLAVFSGTVLFSYFFNRNLFSLKNIVLSVLILAVLSLMVQHFLFGTLYLIDRTALFFYPLFIFSFCFALSDINWKWARNSILVCFVVMWSINFFSHANFFKTAVWYSDSRTTTILSRINNIGKNNGKIIKIDYSWPFQTSFKYYYDQGLYPNIEIVKNSYDREAVNPDADYYVFFNRSLEKVNYLVDNQKILAYKKNVVFQFPEEYIVVYSIIK